MNSWYESIVRMEIAMNNSIWSENIEWFLNSLRGRIMQNVFNGNCPGELEIYIQDLKHLLLSRNFIVEQEDLFNLSSYSELISLVTGMSKSYLANQIEQLFMEVILPTKYER
ncbi:TPA: hypothetical protein ACGO2X_001173 [Streptococcus suis]